VRVVLASGSPRRRELLAALVPEFDVGPADIEEPLGADAVADATSLAAAKAAHVAGAGPTPAVIGADTVVFDAERSYGKPRDEADARAMLRELQGRDHCVVTGVAVANGDSVETDTSVATVTMRPLTADQIDRYVATGVPLDKAGAYAIQHEAFPVVERLAGCYCSVMGLPLWRLWRLLRTAGIDCAMPDATYERCRSCPDREAMQAGSNTP
jgi:septum formation protein